MKKTVIIIVAVALLGLVGLYTKNQDNDSSGLELKNNSVTRDGSSNYKNGTHEGNAAETPYGAIRVAVVISGGKIIDIKFLDMPDSDERSTQITRDSKPLLKQSALDKQSTDIDFISGATSTVYGYQESLQYALDRAKMN